MLRYNRGNSISEVRSRGYDIRMGIYGKDSLWNEKLLVQTHLKRVLVNWKVELSQRTEKKGNS